MKRNRHDAVKFDARQSLVAQSAHEQTAEHAGEPYLMGVFEAVNDVAYRTATEDDSDGAVKCKRLALTIWTGERRCFTAEWLGA